MRRLLTCLVLSLASSTPGTLHAQGAVEDTRRWLVTEYLGRFDAHERVSKFSSDSARWEAIRHRPETVGILGALARDSATETLIRGNAVLALGGTGQRAAFEELITIWRSLPANSPLRQNVILALGSGRATRPDAVFALLEGILGGNNLYERRAAAFALQFEGSPRSRRILEARVTRETHPGLREFYAEMLRRIDGSVRERGGGRE